MSSNAEHEIKKLTETEREAAAGMIMISIRGYWGNAYNRINLLQELAESTDLEDKERIIKNCKDFKEQEHFDGRRFRGMPTYDKVLNAEFDEDTLRTVNERVIKNLKHDMSWNDSINKIDRIYE